MARIVVALYDDFASANDAVRELVDNSFSRDDISLMASDASGEFEQYYSGRPAESAGAERPSAAASGAGAGAGIGAVLGGLGGLLVGLGVIAIPGIGPVLAAGPLAAALSGLAGAGIGAVAGGVTGGLIGALTEMGIPEEEAGYYAEGVRRGGTLVTVRSADHMADRARTIMNRHDPVDMNERVSSWRERGWSGYEQEGEMYPAKGMEQPMSRQTGMEMGPRADFDTYSGSFRQHYQTSLAGTGYPYDYYEPAYRYGYELAGDERRASRQWEEIEPEVRQDWEQEHPGTWEQVKNSVRHAWEEVKETFR